MSLGDAHIEEVVRAGKEKRGEISRVAKLTSIRSKASLTREDSESSRRLQGREFINHSCFLGWRGKEEERTFATDIRREKAAQTKNSRSARTFPCETSETTTYSETIGCVSIPIPSERGNLSPIAQSQSAETEKGERRRRRRQFMRLALPLFCLLLVHSNSPFLPHPTSKNLDSLFESNFSIFSDT